MTHPNIQLYEPLANTIQSLIENFSSIPPERKSRLKEATDFIEGKLRARERAELVFICTHNSRRSHISQIWAQVAAGYYGLKDVFSYSGGTETTAFNPRAVHALKAVGFEVRKISSSENPRYEVSFSDKSKKVVAFSKRYDSEWNPQSGFAAVMTCSHADENCPLVQGMARKISLPYNDPKDFDGHPHETEKYIERVKEIGTEILYAFSIVNIDKP